MERSAHELRETKLWENFAHDLWERNVRKLRETELRENFVRIYGKDKETEKREGGLSPISAGAEDLQASETQES